MLNNFVHPASVSIGGPVEGVQAVQGLAPYSQLAGMMPTFELPEQGGKPEDEETDTPIVDAEEAEFIDENVPELFRLTMSSNFREMLQNFLTPGHEEVLAIRNEVRKERDDSLLTTLAPTGAQPGTFEKIRKNLYLVQMQLFRTPKGLHCHLII